MRILVGLGWVVALGGCNQVFGLEPPSERVSVDALAAPADAARGPDAASDDAATDAAVDAATDAPTDAAVDAPVSSCGTRGTPCASGGFCNGAGACVACTTDSHCGPPPPMQCTMPVCSAADTCTVGPAPRDSFCNNWNDQCDGAGNCVECTTSGGCGECCVCSNQVCIPA